MNNGYYLNESERVWAPVSSFGLEGKVAELTRHLLYLDNRVEELLLKIARMEQNVRRK
jgi:hypothetical protein